LWPSFQNCLNRGLMKKKSKQPKTTLFKYLFFQIFFSTTFGIYF
jgi:hypothetical protein